VIVSVFLSKTTKYGVPSVVLFIIIGMMAGVDGFGGIDFYDIRLSKFIGTLALIFILFSGGLDTRLADIRPVLKSGIILSTLGVLLTTFFTALFVFYVTQLSLVESFLLGAIVSSTDAAAVFTVLRSKKAGLKNNIRPLLELESGSNDPMAYFLTLLFISILQNPESSFINFVLFFLKQFIFGALCGWGMGKITERIINRIDLSFEGLYSVLLLSLAIFSFAVTDIIGGNGFLAVYIAACVLGNKDFVHKRSLVKHFDGQAWLLQIIMFLTLGLLVYPSNLLPLTGVGLLVSLFIVFVSRPLAVFISLAWANFGFRSKLFISWVGLRGAVPIILAIYALNAKVPNAGFIFNIVFFISISSVVIQGSTMSYLAKYLHLAVPISLRKKSTVDIELANKVKSILIELDVLPEYQCAGKLIVELHLPEGIVISMLNRNNKFFVPQGSTQVMVGDKLTIMADSVKSLQEFYRRLGVEK
jgi:cell volume regulation protein A